MRSQVADVGQVPGDLEALFENPYSNPNEHWLQGAFWYWNPLQTCWCSSGCQVAHMDIFGVPGVGSYRPGLLTSSLAAPSAGAGSCGALCSAFHSTGVGSGTFPSAYNRGPLSSARLLTLL